ncbi:nucleotidyltransferase family protein [Paenibacillus sp. JX-17]|uniref:Nucleotidyltransferase family protein n=1 Tax=Paenibacillus lacisoli TaxID=3064525 RepID=A0ABT9CF10_9BACL|nr:nucleotidyltransferase family protein [Paenibacillus sp. JX-17]MDO7907224.1 nucleotidyltransferase family protein [Paenibacillus sp. JX-17]
MADKGLDISVVTLELQFICELIGSRKGFDLPGREEVYRHLNWDSFLDLAKHHRVYPNVYQILTSLQLDYVPEKVMEELRKECSSNAFTMLRLAAESGELSERLSNEGIRVLALKGPVLAQELYGSYALRTSKDLDILVSMDDARHADAVLKEMGYVPKSELPHISVAWKWREHHWCYAHPQKRIQVELHWRLNSDLGSEPGFEELWSARKSCQITGKPVHYLGSDHLISYLLSHGCRHGWFRLRWLSDIQTLIDHGTDWEGVVRHLQQYGQEFAAGQAMVLLTALFRTKPPAGTEKLMNERSQQLASASLKFIMDPTPITQAKRSYWSYLFSLKSTRQKSAFIMLYLLPGQRDAATIKLPRQLHFMYFVLRPFLWGWRQIAMRGDKREAKA